MTGYSEVGSFPVDCPVRGKCVAAECCAPQSQQLNCRMTSGYELDEQTLSPIDSVALTPMRHPKDPQKGLVLDPSWTLDERRRNWMSCSQLAFNSGDLAFQEIITSRPYRDSDRPIAPLLTVCADHLGVT